MPEIVIPLPRRGRARDPIRIKTRGKFAVTIDHDLVKVLASQFLDTVKTRINAISTPPKPATIKRRGPGRLFNVTGQLRSTLALEVTSKKWRIIITKGRSLVPKQMTQLIDVASLESQEILAAPEVRFAMQAFLKSMVKNTPFIGPVRQ